MSDDMARDGTSFILNNKPVTVRLNPSLRLIDVLRDHLGLTGTKEGCGIGECGACTVLLDGKAVNSCLVLLGQARDRRITTIEGLESPDGGIHPVQQAFIDQHAVQCGFCTPGMVMSAVALLETNPHPTREEIKVAISGNMCRCTGYEPIVAAVEQAAHQVREDKGGR